MKVVVLIFISVALLFIGIGGSQVVSQQRMISRALPMRAVVESSTVKVTTQHDNKQKRSTTYTPVVKYAYTVDGRAYGAERVFPISTACSKRRAEQIVADHPAGKQISAWYVAGEPGRTFLLREWSFTPYLFVQLPMIHLTIGLAFLAAAGLHTRVIMQPLPAGGGWMEIPIKAALAKRRRPWMLATLAWFAIGGAAIAHYFVYADSSFPGAEWIISLIYLAVGLIPAIFFLRYWRLTRQANDARLFTNLSNFEVGQTINVRTEQRFHRHLLIDAYRIGLICDKTDVTVSGGKQRATASKLFEDWKDVLENEQASAAQALEVKTVLTIPADMPPSSADQKQYPIHAWRIAVEARIPGAPDYKADFPIVVGVPHSGQRSGVARRS